MVSLGLVSTDAEAARLGRGRPAGMQRQMPAKPADATPAKPAPPVSPAAAPGSPATPPAAANAGKRSWLGPIAGLAAGLGLAALFSHFGMGEGFSNIIMMLLLAGVAFVAIRWLMQRFAGAGARSPAAGGLQYASAGAPAAGATTAGLPDAVQPFQRSALEAVPEASPAMAPGVGAAPVASTPTLPDGITNADFERLAKMVFIRLQAANDACQVDDLRKFTTPELFASLRADLLERGNATQKTDVLQLDAKVVDTAEQDGQHIVTVRFQGLIREAAEAGAEPFDELWHLVRPLDASRDWAIAGITPTH